MSSRFNKRIQETEVLRKTEKQSPQEFIDQVNDLAKKLKAIDEQIAQFIDDPDFNFANYNGKIYLRSYTDEMNFICIVENCSANLRFLNRNGFVKGNAHTCRKELFTKEEARLILLERLKIRVYQGGK